VITKCAVTVKACRLLVAAVEFPVTAKLDFQNKCHIVKVSIILLDLIFKIFLTVFGLCYLFLRITDNHDSLSQYSC